MTKVWSAYQQAIFDFVADSNAGNGIVSAVAGSGKTTTIVEAMKLVKGTTLFLAFNKSIQTELQMRGVNARTFHSLTNGVVGRVYTGGLVADKLRGLCSMYKNAGDRRSDPFGLVPPLSTDEFPMFTDPYNFKDFSAFAVKLVGLARNMGIGCITEDTEKAWFDLCQHHDLEPDNGGLPRGIMFARELLRLSNQQNTYDFDDMLYYAVRDNLNLPKYDVVFVDEAQDTNPLQIAIVKKVLRPGGRLIAVGDASQAIYGFRGAGSDSMASIQEEFNCTPLPLSISYRCPETVVQFAQQWDGNIQAAPGAAKGEVNHMGIQWSVESFKANDIVLCRRSAPLLALAYQCIRSNVRCYVMGRDIGDGLISLVKRMGKVDNNIDELVARLDRYHKRELAKLDSEKDAVRIETLNDKVSSLVFLCEILVEDKRTVDKLVETINYLFAQRDQATRLCTIHKAKGLEAETVYWYGKEAYACDFSRMPWQAQQEDNLRYVAATRAKATLNLIEPLVEAA